MGAVKALGTEAQGARNLDLRAAAARLGVSHHTLRAWSIYQRRIPFLRLGRRVLFRLEDLEAFERRGRVKAIPR
jgi:excisionase family DNA binding protein